MIMNNRKGSTIITLDVVKSPLHKLMKRVGTVLLSEEAHTVLWSLGIISSTVLCAVKTSKLSSA